jgi:hypothetical protein
MKKKEEGYQDMTKTAEMIGSYCTRHGHAPDVSGRFCLNCAEPLTAASATEVPAVTTEPLTGIDATLAERGARYGVFAEQGRITQNIKLACQDSPNWAILPPDMREAIDMIASKLSRILNGDPTYDDNWRDIVGYAKLVLDRLEREQIADIPEKS